MKSFLRALTPAFVSIFAISSAVGASESSSTSVIKGEPIALGELRNATYRGLQFVKHPITLANGKWEGAPYAPGGASRPSVSLIRDFHISADLDVDGQGDAIVLLSENNGGSGSLTNLAVVKRRGEKDWGRLVNVATALLGDRVQVRKLEVRGRRISVTMVQGGPFRCDLLPVSL